MNLRQLVFEIAVLTIVLFVTSCSGIFNSGTKGNGIVITENRKVYSFSEIDGVFNAILSQGIKEAVSIESDENLIDLKKNTVIGKYTKFNVFVTIVNITKMSMASIEDLSVENRLEFKNSGVGGILVFNLESNSSIVYNSDVGDVTYSGNPKFKNINDNAVGDVVSKVLIKIKAKTRKNHAYIADN